MDIFDSFGWFVLVFFLILATFAGIIMAVAYPISSYSCSRTAEAMGLGYKYSLWTGCLVKTPGGRWMTLDKYNATAIDNLPKDE